MKNNHRMIRHHLTGILVLLCTLAAGVGAQELRSQGSVHDAAVISVSSSDSVTLDSTLVITIRAENRGRFVEEAVVSLIDSASGDTIENWYPLFPPECADSTMMFWNTKGAKAGNHTLKAILVIPLDSQPADNEQKHVVTIKPWR
jgi:hypothetical protein